MRLIHLAILALAIAFQANAQGGLEQTVMRHLETSIASDQFELNRRFAPLRFAAIFEANPEFAGDGEYASMPEDEYGEIIAAQLPPEALANIPGNAEVRVVVLETCWASLSRYGIPEDIEFHGFSSADIDRIRLNLAFKAAGINIQLSNNQVESLRGFDQPDESSRNNALNSLNRYLLGMYYEGYLPAPHFVLDYSEGCGAGEIEVVIKSDPPLTEIYLIPDFYFSVCSDQFPDPWNPAECIWWNAAPSQALVSGTYRFMGKERSGKLKKGRINVSFAAGSEESETDSITLR